MEETEDSSLKSLFAECVEQGCINSVTQINTSDNSSWNRRYSLGDLGTATQDYVYYTNTTQVKQDTSTQLELLNKPYIDSNVGVGCSKSLREQLDFYRAVKSGKFIIIKTSGEIEKLSSLEVAYLKLQLELSISIHRALHGLSINKEGVTYTSSDKYSSACCATVKVDMSKYPLSFRDCAWCNDVYSQYMKINIPPDFPVDKSIDVSFNYLKGAQTVEEALHDLLHYNLRKIKQ